MENQRICLNCNYSVFDKYCPNCGQRVNVPKLTFKEIFLDFLNSVFNLDSPFIKTTVGLFVKPQIVVLGYIDGKRKAYYSPIRYLVVCLFINLLIGEALGFDPIENQKAISGVKDVDTGSRAGYELGNFLARYLNYFLFLLPLCIALVSKIFFWKTERNMAERSVFGFYMSGLYISITLMPILLTLISPWLMQLIYPLTAGYLAYGFYKVFYQKSKALTIVKSIFAAIISILLYFVIASVLAYIIMNYFNLKG